jgi:hypothetical protein
MRSILGSEMGFDPRMAANRKGIATLSANEPPRALQKAHAGTRIKANATTCVAQRSVRQTLV